MPRELWIALALAGTFWVLAGVNEKPGRGRPKPIPASRGDLRVMIAAELLAASASRAAIAASFVIGAAVVIANVQVLRDAYIAIATRAT